jgi:ubiquinone/menaquinone biosynthesis C-methylase UbiE
MRLVPRLETYRVMRRRLRRRLRDSKYRPSKLWMQFTSLPLFWRPERGIADPNTLFSRKRCRDLRGHVQRLVHRDGLLLMRLSDPRIAGVRSWEYGTLLAALHDRPERAGWRAIDIGSGRSTFPRYLLAQGHVAEMTTLDLPDPTESASDVHVQDDAALGVNRVEGSMLALPMADESFDLVTCISAIEHLDGDRKTNRRNPEGRPPYDQYVAQTRTALIEMARVLAPGGLMYVTTDAYIPELQQTDTWSSPNGRTPILSAYRFEDIEDVFVAAVRSAGLELVGQPNFRRELLEDDPDRSSFRGRYFTTFAILARKPAG